ncbi:MAG TPA: hypothetical protein VMT18_09745 [Planctomycetota bacterium]|nr:hypothetical protein [Planctomycetota bacterium]
MPPPVQRGPRAVARVRSAPWRKRGGVLALASLAALWVAVRVGLLSAAPALALGLLVAAAWGLGAQRPGAR